MLFCIAQLLVYAMFFIGCLLWDFWLSYFVGSIFFSIRICLCIFYCFIDEVVEVSFVAIYMSFYVLSICALV